MATKPQSKVSPTGSLLPRVVRTLLVGGYTIDACDRPADEAVLLRLRRMDVLGGEGRVVLLVTRHASTSLLIRLQREAKSYAASATVIRQGGPLPVPIDVRQFSLAEFFSTLGGEIRTDRIFAPKLIDWMNALGHRRVPHGMKGKAETLLEEYSQDIFSYLLESPVRRFGQERAFEKVPDGLVLARGRLNICLDAKAYSGGYHPSAPDMRAFADYIRDFNGRYADMIGPVSVFVVVSGHFRSSRTALTSRSNELLSETQTPLVFMAAKDASEAVELVRASGRARGALDWRKILIPPVFDLTLLKAELRRLRRDGIV